VRTLRWVVLVVSVFVALGAGAFYIAWRNSGAHEASLSAAMARFARAVEVAPTAKLQPPAGVYTYRGSGSEHLDKPPKTQQHGPVIPATVIDQPNGCWDFRVDYNAAHWQSWTFCPHNGGLEDAGGATYENWNFVAFQVKTKSTMSCQSTVLFRRAMRVGDHSDGTCTGTESDVGGVTTTSGPDEFLGTEQVDVGGVTVAAYHVREDHAISGAQSGTTQDDFWLATTNGMPLRNERKYVVKSESPIGPVTYTEAGSFALTSLVPQT